MGENMPLCFDGAPRNVWESSTRFIADTPAGFSDDFDKALDREVEDSVGRKMLSCSRSR